jgi:hypothetical protein
VLSSQDTRLEFECEARVHAADIGQQARFGICGHARSPRAFNFLSHALRLARSSFQCRAGGINHRALRGITSLPA